MSPYIKNTADPCISRFAYIAARFCAYIDSRNKVRGRAFIGKAQRLVAELYAAALDLPNVPVTSSRTLATVPAFAEWKRIRNMIAEKTRRQDLYWEIYNAYDNDDCQPVCGSLADDLADIYQDLMTGLVSYRKGTAKAVFEAGWHWRFSFWSHWGEHATSALRAMYWVQKGREIP